MHLGQTMTLALAGAGPTYLWHHGCVHGKPHASTRHCNNLARLAQSVVASAPLSAIRQHLTTWTSGSWMMFARIPILGMRVTCVYIYARPPQ